MLTFLLALWVTTLSLVSPSVPLLETVDVGGNQGACGTAIYSVVDGEAFALTAAHCVAQVTSLTVGGKHAVVVKSNDVLDLAVVKFKASSEKPLEMAGANPPVGEELAVLGYPFESQQLVTKFGRVARPSDGKFLWIDLMLIPGDSGGPLVNESGHLVGIASRVRLDEHGARVAFAVPVDVIREFLK